MKRNYLLIVIAVCIAIVSETNSCLAVQAPDFRVVALSGTPIPGVGTLRRFNTPVINALGQTAFEADEAVVIRGGSQVYSEGSGALEHVGRSNSTAAIRLNAAGQTVYVSSEYSNGIFSKKPGEPLETIAQNGDRVPGADNSVGFSRIVGVGLSDSGRVTFGATLQNVGESSNDFGIFSHESGVLTSVVQEGDLSPVPVGPFLNPHSGRLVAIQ